MTGEKILSYKIENLTEENQLFRSFLATHTLFSKQVIVKTLKTLSKPEEKFEFIAEIRRLAQVQHPNVITLYDYLETANEFYLIFEYIEGKTLHQYINQISGPIPEEKVKQLFDKILDAFALAHQKGLMLGAVNSENILVTPQEEIKVLDLALSRFFQKKSIETQDKWATSFASPEQLKEQFLDQRSDIYSLGVLLFQMLTGHQPYQGINWDEMKQMICFEPLPPTAKFYPMVSEEMQQIIRKATSKNPAERFQTCQEFQQAIRKMLHPTLPTNVDNPLITTENKENSSKSQPKNVLKEAIPYETKFVNFPLYFLIGISSLTVLLMIWYSLPQTRYDSEVLFDLQDTKRIAQLQDSIAKAQEQKALQDSVKVFQQFNKKDTVQFYYHKVIRGDNLEKIAKRYYNPLDSIKKWNALTGKEKLRPREGIKVKIRQVYKMKRNEDLFMVAQKFGISAVVLRDVNKLYPKTPAPGEEPEPVVFEGKDIVIPLLPLPKK